MTRKTLAVLFLVGVNAIPLVGVIFYDWNLFSIMFLYWFENGIIGFFNVFKIARAGKPSAGTNLTINGRPSNLSGAVFYVPFFIAHYGIFWVVHGVFVIVLFGLFGGQPFGGVGPPEIMGGFRGFEPGGVAIAALSLFLSHGVSFYVNFLGNEEYLNVSPDEQMFQPYGRVIALHVTILGGGFLAGYLGTPLASLVLLIVLKTAIDIWAHLREHRKAESRSADPAPGQIR
ncbi:MAG TPA: DUF6498-containing protein [Rubrobacteraceae bacterium]|nr:DUF6498-containing protein [Rubrobacteraceae bacterium]